MGRRGRRQSHGDTTAAFLAARVSLRFDDTKAGLDATQEWEALYGPLDGGLDLDRATEVDYDDRDLRPEAPAAAAYVLPSVARQAAFFRDATRDPAAPHRHGDARAAPQRRARPLLAPGRDGGVRFPRRRGGEAAADAETAKIRDRLETKRDRLERALETARRKVEEASTEQSSRRSTELLSGLGSVVGVLLGGKADTRTIARAGRALGGAASRRGMTTRERAEAERRGEGRARRVRPRGAGAGDPRRGGGDRREVGAEGGRNRVGADPARGGRARGRDDARLGPHRLTRVALLAVLLCASCGGTSAPSGAVTVDSVRDGDTILLEDGRRVRLVQVDAPELGRECYGDAAAGSSPGSHRAGRSCASSATRGWTTSTGTDACSATPPWARRT